MQAENTALLRHKAALRLTRSCEEFMGCMVFYEVDEKAIS
jgi:hypothetical protein